MLLLPDATCISCLGAAVMPAFCQHAFDLLHFAAGQLRTSMDSEVSLRPLSLKPGGGKANPFAGFGKGAGAGIKKQVTSPDVATDRLQGRPAGAARLLHAQRVVLQSPRCNSAQALRWLNHASSIPVERGHSVYLSCNMSWMHVRD